MVSPALPVNVFRLTESLGKKQANPSVLRKPLQRLALRVSGQPGKGPSTLGKKAVGGTFVVLVVRPGKVAYSSGCEARPGRSSQPLGSESLNRIG